MAKTLKEASITTASSRSKLPAGEFARRIDPDAAVWYRKGKRGGTWFARWRNYGAGANYRQAPIGPANDVNDKLVQGLLTFREAEQEAKKLVASARAEMKAALEGPPATVADAVRAYSEERDARDSRRKGKATRSDAAQRLARYVTGQGPRGKQPARSPAPLADVTLASLTEKDLMDWRADLPAEMKATTRQRLINDLKAALNGAYSRFRAQLDPAVPAIIKHGLKAAQLDEDDAVPIARENQILSDEAVSNLVAAARQVDEDQGWDGDLYRLVLVMAATGGRFSQCSRIRVADCQLGASRILVPSSRKGKGAKAVASPVPIGSDVVQSLRPIVDGRDGQALLLERWRKHQTAPGVWVKTKRGPWGSSELSRPWQGIRQRSGLPGVIPYALRHSSIVRGLRSNLPIRLVAALHDTSVAMIERHYGRYIANGLEDLAAKAVVRLVM